MSGSFWVRPGPARTLAVAALVAVIVGVALSALPRGHAAEGWMADRVAAARVMLYGPRPLASEHVVIVALDQRSLDAPALKARPRALFSPIFQAVIERALGHGARGVGLDFVLAYDARWLEVDGDVPLKSYDNGFLRLLRDERGAGRIVLGTSAGLPPADRFARLAGAGALGMVEIPVGAGNVLREVPAANALAGGGEMPTLSGLMRARAGDETGTPVRIVPPAPLDTLPVVSLIDVLACDDAQALGRVFGGRLVLVGSTLASEDRLKMPDRLMPRENATPATGAPCDFPPPVVRTAGQEMLPGVYAHAAAVDGALSGWAPRPVAPALVTALAVAAGLAAALIALTLRPAAGVVALLVVALAVFAIAVIALAEGHLVPSATPLSAAFIGFGLTWGARLGLLDRQANATRRAFGRYLSPVLVDAMIERGESPSLGGEERDVTIMFADLSGFTATSEKMESADLTAILNAYLDRIDTVIRASHGYVDKFIGDAVMAIWNAPARIDDHALAAVEAAYRIQDVVAERAAEDRARGLPGFTIKIGISSGPATVGNVGSHNRLNYTVIGDTVNQAARFESLPGLFRTPIVIGPVTAARVASAFQLLPIVAIQVKGRAEGLRVFAPLARVGGADLGLFFEEYALALAAFEDGSFRTARQLWEDLAARDWPGAGIAAAMAGEAQYMEGQLLQSPWTGVLEARSK